MPKRSHQSATTFRADADQYRRLAQFVSGGTAKALIDGAAALDAKAARMERRRKPIRLLRRLAGRHH